MSNLQTRKSRLVFTTAGEVKERGRYRAVVIEAQPHMAQVRLQGMRSSFPISYEAIYHAAAKLAAIQERAEKKAKKA